MSAAPIPKQQRAVQLVGPDQLQMNETKPVLQPGPDQVLDGWIVGLCFSDLKLLKQFSAHARKSPITAGIAPELLRQMPNYVPGDQPAVPGHETVIRLVQVARRCPAPQGRRALPGANRLPLAAHRQLLLRLRLQL